MNAKGARKLSCDIEVNNNRSMEHFNDRVEHLNVSMEHLNVSVERLKSKISLVIKRFPHINKLSGFGRRTPHILSTLNNVTPLRINVVQFF
jgi:hypothetical protein